MMRYPTFITHRKVMAHPTDRRMESSRKKRKARSRKQRYQHKPVKLNAMNHAYQAYIRSSRKNAYLPTKKRARKKKKKTSISPEARACAPRGHFHAPVHQCWSPCVHRIHRCPDRVVALRHHWQKSRSSFHSSNP